MINEKPCIRIQLTDTKPTIFESKVGGLGYIPHDGNFPVDKEGNQLRLLAQIDCSQIDFEPFPKTGLLQFWILCDDVYGCDFDNPTEQDTFRIIYYPEIDRTVTEEEIQQKVICPPVEEEDEDEYYEEFISPVEKECGMLFAPGISYQLPDYCQPDSDWDTYTELSEKEGHLQHRIGGYPYFTQSDPREEDSPYDFLLFQLDSDSDSGGNERVMWGDSGIGNFFINSQKLKNLDFSDVLYNWDCC